MPAYTDELMVATKRKAKPKRKGRRVNSPRDHADHPRTRVRPDVEALLAVVGERQVNDMSELDVARMRRFVLDRVYTGEWCRQRARFVWLTLEEIAEDLERHGFQEVGARLLPIVRRSMPVGLAYAALDSGRREGSFKIG